jgi:hypothetical protein
MWNNIVWNDVIEDSSIELFEHPVYNSFVTKDQFFEEFQEVLKQLNGETMSDYVDFFFRKDHVFTNSLIFNGENEKLDFYDWAVECNCLPTLKEIHNGEDNIDKELRKELERLKLENNLKSKIIQKEKQINKLIDQELNMLYSIKKNIEELIIKIETTQKDKFQKKLSKAVNHFNQTYQNYKVNNYEVEVFETFIVNINL